MLDFPNNPTQGQQYLSWQFDGVKWVAIPAGGPGGGASITVSDTPPSSPAVGAMWYDSVGNNLYVWTTDGNSTQWAVAVSPPYPQAQTTAGNTGRNLVHNGQFAIAQRGVGPWTTGGYTLDRWALNNQTDAASVVQQALADSDRAAIGDESVRYGLLNTFTGNAAAAAYNEVYQKIEGLRRLSGKTVTISFWATASAVLKLGINITQNFGTGGSPSASVGALVTGASVTLVTTWARYSTTIALPSTAGKTFGTNGDDNTQLRIAFSSGATLNQFFGNIGVQSGTVILWGVQLEIGSGYGFPTMLAKRDPADDLALCQRFYQVGYTALYGYTAASNLISNTQLFPVTMRAIPAIAFSGTGYSNASAIQAQFAGPAYVTIAATGTAAGAAAFTTNWTASADL